MKPSLTTIIPNLPTIQCVDVGANPIDGQAPYLPLLQKNIAEVIGFEPDAKALAVLNQQKSNLETYLPFAVGDGNNHTFHRCQAPGMSSLLKPNKETLSYFHGFPEWGKVLETSPIETYRLDDLEAVKSIDYLKIDIQGGELMVFQNGQQKLRDTLVIHTEVEFLPMYEGQPLFAEVELFLRGLGFIFHKFEPLVSRVVKPLMLRNNPYAGLSQQVWADAIFIKNFMQLDALSNDALLKYAVILHDIYGSYDIVLRALLAYDERQLTSYSQVYASKIL
ncbi:MAG: FkbM family methyltransferase [Saprospiraceae bacterium]|nr:FkbM family methyltransferase [Saprospiraceae bacterium]